MVVLYLISSSPNTNEPRAALFASSTYPILPFVEKEKGDGLNYDLDDPGQTLKFHGTSWNPAVSLDVSGCCSGPENQF